MDSANKSTMPHPSGPIIAGNCISCMGMVRISHAMSVNATVRCPHCQESFVLAELLDQSLPPLEVVVNPRELDEAGAPYIDTLHLKKDDPGSKAEKPRVKFEIPKALKDGAKRKRRRRRRSRSSSGTGTSGSSNSNGSVVSTSSSSTASSSAAGGTSSGTAVAPGETFGEAVERRRSRSGDQSSRSSHRGRVRSSTSRAKEAAAENSALRIAKIVAGCVVALPLAYLVLFWIFKADPMGFSGGSDQVSPNAVTTSPDTGLVTGGPRELPSYLDDENDTEPFVPKPISDGDDRIAIPDIDPDEVFGQEFGL